ncbi:MAG TPA: ribokinase [Thermomicrobiaceae bacterium]|nr:ribokinase [Thermomicrobiaceae bacterium]
MTSVVVVGSINTDLVARVRRFPAAGETVFAESFETFGGGKGANQAVAAARLGAATRLIGAVGTDAESQARLDALGAGGVDCAGVRRVPGRGGLALIEVENVSGQNRITVVPGANALVDGALVATALGPALAPGDIVCCQLEVPLEAVEAALRLGRAGGALTVLNAVPARVGLEPLLALADVLVVNEIEAGQLLGGPPVALADAGDGAAALRELGPRSVVLTFGAAGVFLLSGEQGLLEPAPTVSVVDTTGAGDALVGALCAELARGASLDSALATGVAAASFAVQRAGAQPSFPTRPELDDWRRTLARAIPRPAG